MMEKKSQVLLKTALPQQSMQQVLPHLAIASDTNAPEDFFVALENVLLVL